MQSPSTGCCGTVLVTAEPEVQGNAVSLPVPNSLQEVLDPAWLSHALGQRFPGVTVASLEPWPIVSRVSTNARFHVECQGGLPSGLPADLCDAMS